MQSTVGERVAASVGVVHDDIVDSGDHFIGQPSQLGALHLAYVDDPELNDTTGQF